MKFLNSPCFIGQANCIFFVSLLLSTPRSGIDPVILLLRILHDFPLDGGQNPKFLSGRAYKFRHVFCHVHLPTCVHSPCHSLWLIHTALLTGFQMFQELYSLVHFKFASRDCLECFSSLFWIILTSLFWAPVDMSSKITFLDLES